MAVVCWIYLQYFLPFFPLESYDAVYFDSDDEPAEGGEGADGETDAAGPAAQQSGAQGVAANAGRPAATKAASAAERVSLGV